MSDATKLLMSDIVGMSLATAVALVKSQGFILRETFRDGSPLIVTKDHRTDRINVATDNGIITSVGVFG